MECIGQRIMKSRKAKGMTQKDLAILMCVTDKAISSWESNRTSPSLDDVLRLSDLLDITSTYLLYGDIESLDIETEIKIKISDEEYKHIDFIMSKEAKCLKENRQIDTYYNPKYRSFLGSDRINEWLRIGERGGKIILNYKNWYDVHCDEYEVLIDNKENMEKIFKILDLEKIAVVCKDRKTYLYNDKYEVALDKVEDLGYFIEIEVKKYDDSILEEYDKLLKVARSLNLDVNNIDRRGYPYYLIDLNNT